MIQKRSTFVLVVFAAAVIMASAATGVFGSLQAGPAHSTDLSGQWQLNHELSENPQDKLPNMGGSGSHHGGGGGQGGGHHAGGAAPGGDQQHPEQALNLLLNAPDRFLLTQDDQKVVITESDGHVRTLQTNNHKAKVDGHDVQARWDNNHLVTETGVGNAKVTETYERSPSAHQLIVTTTIDVSGEHVSVRRVYDAVK
jgi:hypothetical protein